ncbi:uncharacterized protein LOC128218296 [Mya arenaria]|uniref:uncharacterized protein LOC128218296 n=1 Tax=Mya arenaria TaxID=6604 RepID=UPI0022E7DA92|nr:uncharacterized protein LOC128218296 [Mya arenaria]
MASKFESSIHRGGDFIHDFTCSPCEENGLNTEAQHFCKECSKYYCNKCAPVHNTLYNRHTVFGRKDLDNWAGSTTTISNAVEICERHPGKSLELVCDDHDQLCCHVCIAVDHRKCSKVQHIPYLAKGIYKDADFKSLPGKVSELRKQLHDMEEARKGNTASLKTTRAAILDEIKAIRKKMNEILDDIERTTIEELNCLVDKLEDRIKEDGVNFAQMDDELKYFVNFIEASNRRNNEPSSYIGYRKCKAKIREVNGLIPRRYELDTYAVSFRANNVLKEMLSSVRTFGEIEELTMATKLASSQHLDPNHVFKETGYKKYNVALSTDIKVCLIVDICELPGGEIAVLDFNNLKVKLLDQKYEVVDHCDVPQNPFSVCHIGGNDAVVCIGFEWQFINITKGKIVKTKRINCTHSCSDVAYHGDMLYVCSGTALYVYMKSGQMMQTFYEDESGGLTVERCSFRGDGNVVYITDRENARIICLDRSGNKLNTFTDPDMREPTSIHVTTAGHVFVSTDNLILQIDKNGTRKLATLHVKKEHLTSPRALLFSSRTSGLIVGGYSNSLLKISLE